jgi:hypothetical protein
MNPNWLWLVWAVLTFGGFAALEFAGLRRAGDVMEPLTYWIRAGISASPALIGAGLFMGIAWAVFHFFIEAGIREAGKRGKAIGKRVANRIRAKRKGVK